MTKGNTTCPRPFHGGGIKNSGGRSEINFFFFLILFPIQVKTLQIQTQIMRVFKGLFPVSIECLHTCRIAHIFALVANTKICSVFLEQIRFLFEPKSLHTDYEQLKSAVKFLNDRTSTGIALVYIVIHFDHVDISYYLSFVAALRYFPIP
jgi:hypothetical protein